MEATLENNDLSESYTRRQKNIEACRTNSDQKDMLEATTSYFKADFHNTSKMIEFYWKQENSTLMRRMKLDGNINLNYDLNMFIKDNKLPANFTWDKYEKYINVKDNELIELDKVIEPKADESIKSKHKGTISLTVSLLTSMVVTPIMFMGISEGLIIFFSIILLIQVGLFCTAWVFLA